MGVSAQLVSRALEGLDRAEAELERTAERIARLPVSAGHPEDQVNLSEEMVKLIRVRHSYEANLKVLQTANEMEEHLIDVLG
jgi:flagellar hook-associated protein FlgK